MTAQIWLVLTVAALAVACIRLVGIGRELSRANAGQEKWMKRCWCQEKDNNGLTAENERLRTLLRDRLVELEDQSAVIEEYRREKLERSLELEREGKAKLAASAVERAGAGAAKNGEPV